MTYDYSVTPPEVTAPEAPESTAPEAPEVTPIEVTPSEIIQERSLPGRPVEKLFTTAGRHDISKTNNLTEVAFTLCGGSGGSGGTDAGHGGRGPGRPAIVRGSIQVSSSSTVILYVGDKGQNGWGCVAGTGGGVGGTNGGTLGNGGRGGNAGNSGCSGGGGGGGAATYLTVDGVVVAMAGASGGAGGRGLHGGLNGVGGNANTQNRSLSNTTGGNGVNKGGDGGGGGAGGGGSVRGNGGSTWGGDNDAYGGSGGSCYWDTNRVIGGNSELHNTSGNVGFARITVANVDEAEISINDLNVEFINQSNRTSRLGEFYRGGSFVPNTTVNIRVPTSGTIELSDFYGATNIVLGSANFNYNRGGQRENDYRGYTSLYTYTAGTSKINEISWDPYYEYNAGHWNGNVSQYLQVRNTANSVIWSYTLNGLNPSRTVFTSDRTKAYRVKENGVEEAISGYVHAPALGTLNPNTRYSIWQAAQTRTGPPYGVMSARGNIQSSFQFIPQ